MMHIAHKPLTYSYGRQEGRGSALFGRSRSRDNRNGPIRGHRLGPPIGSVGLDWVGEGIFVSIVGWVGLVRKYVKATIFYCDAVGWFGSSKPIAFLGWVGLGLTNDGLG